jgi:hypothetical protein
MTATSGLIQTLAVSAANEARDNGIGADSFEDAADLAASIASELAIKILANANFEARNEGGIEEAIRAAIAA